MLLSTLLQCTVLHYPAMHHQALVSLSQQMHFYSQVSSVSASVSEVHCIVMQYYEVCSLVCCTLMQYSTVLYTAVQYLEVE